MFELKHPYSKRVQIVYSVAKYLFYMYIAATFATRKILRYRSMKPVARTQRCSRKSNNAVQTHV